VSTGAVVDEADEVDPTSAILMGEEVIGGG